ncbi:MAG: hypothetical protein AB8H80_17565 [Planctomycetota bacterium]
MWTYVLRYRLLLRATYARSESLDPVQPLAAAPFVEAAPSSDVA